MHVASACKKCVRNSESNIPPDSKPNMACVCVEVCCSPNGEDKYAVPTTIKIVRIFADTREAAKEFSTDQAFKAESEFAGQDIYYLLWKTDEPLNIDRCIVGDNTISNVGMWLPDSDRIYSDVSDLEVELVPPQRVKARAKVRERAQRQATQERSKTRKHNTKVDRGESGFGHEDEGQSRSRLGSAAGGATIGRGRGGGMWNKQY
jgi:hypothetical protein